MTKTLTLGWLGPAPRPGRGWVWARRGRDAFLVEPRQVRRALAGLDAPLRKRLMARLRANTAGKP